MNERNTQKPTGEVIDFDTVDVPTIESIRPWIWQKIDKIASALAKAQRAFKPLHKNKVGDAGSYKYDYADLADVVESCREALAENEIAVMQTVRKEMLVTTL